MLRLESLPSQQNMIILLQFYSLCTGYLYIKFRISYKMLLLAYKALNYLAPAYLTNLLSRYNPTRSLRSQNSGLLVVPRKAKSTKGGRTFSYLAPKLWNSLPDNVQGSDTLSLFKSKLKTHLFSINIPWYLGITQASVCIQPLNDLRWPNTWEETMTTPRRTSEEANH